jgi:hypothetical protein
MHPEMHPEQNPDQFDAGYRESMRPPEERQAAVDTGALANRLLAEYREAEQARALVELRWLKDLQAYKGQYDQTTIDHLKKTKRSSVYYRLTTQKINTMVARLMDLLFPQRSKNWSLDNTPDPMLPDEIIKEALRDEIMAAAQPMVDAQLQQIVAQGVMPDGMAVQKIQQAAAEAAFQQLNTIEARVRIAKDRAAAMERVIDDQLKEFNANGKLRQSWQSNCKEVVKSACLYGMGVLKGPLVEKVETKRFERVPVTDDAGNAVGAKWVEQVHAKDLRPFHEAVSIWNIFPDPDARTPQEMRFVWQTHLKSDKEMLELADFPGFDGAAIRSHMHNKPDGDATITTWESYIHTLDETSIRAGQLKNRYRVYERWGFLSGKDLADAGINIEESDYTNVYSCNVWMLDETVIKAVINPLEGIDIPYYFYPYQQDDSSIWPEGIASMLRAPQAGINAAVRANQDNSSASSGPIYGINAAYLASGESITDMVANRIFVFDKPNINLDNALRTVIVPSCVEYNLALAAFWSAGADEISTPRFNHGDGAVRGAGETASGLSMLMGAANILLKDHIKDFDECLVGPFIYGMFRWNMQWNKDDSIKGDFEVVVSGSQSLIAKEVRAQQIPALISYLSIPQFATYINKRELLEVSLEQTDLPAERILLSEAEAKQAQMDEAAMQAQAQVSAFASELEQRGASPKFIEATLAAYMQQAMSGGLAQPALPTAPAQGGMQ